MDKIIKELEKSLSANPRELTKNNKFYNISFTIEGVRLQGYSATRVFSDKEVFENFKISDNGFLKTKVKSDKFGTLSFVFDI